jgi:hypothetical protein
MHKQSIAILLSDLRVALAIDDIAAATRRISLFELMYMGDEHEAGEEMSNRKRLALRLDSHEVIVCNEYYPDDGGRVHMIPAHRYGTFNKDSMILEIQKVSLSVVEVIYEGDEWPDAIISTAPQAIIQYFTGDYT